MDFIIRNLKRLYRLIYSSTYVNWFDYLCYYVKGNNSAYVVYPVFFEGLIKNEFEHLFILLGVVQKKFPDAKLISGRKAEFVKGKFIFYNPSELFNYDNRINYTETLCEMVQKWEENGNKVFYDKYEVSFWENKSFMYGKFKECGISHPKTQIIPVENFEPSMVELQFPLLLKEEHSFASRGVHKVNAIHELNGLVCSKSFLDKNKNVILQELMLMHKDLRVIVIGDEIVLHYWRVNTEKEWKPTSTSYGSEVDFVTFPEEWRKLIVDTLRKLELSTGAFDIAWINDDISTTPYFLEVSPSYQPNPPVKTSKYGLSYGQYKKKFRFRDSWDNNFMKIMFDFKTRLFNLWMNKVK